MEIKVAAGDILDKLDKDMIKDAFAQYLQQYGDALLMANDGYWSRKLTPFGKEVVDGLRNELKTMLLDELMKDMDFRKQMDEIKEEVKKEMAAALQKGMVEFIVNGLFMNKDSVSALTYDIMRVGMDCVKY